jgi:hypothetical protein
MFSSAIDPRLTSPLSLLLLQDLIDAALDHRSHRQSQNAEVPPPPSRLTMDRFL